MTDDANAPTAHSPQHALWLAVATAGLWPPAVRAITEETALHLQAAEEMGASPEVALAQLGDPHAAAREYRTSHLPASFTAHLDLHRTLITHLNAAPRRTLLLMSLPLMFGAVVSLNGLSYTLDSGLPLLETLWHAWFFTVPEMLPLALALTFLLAAPRQRRGGGPITRLLRLYRLFAVLLALQFFLQGVVTTTGVVRGTAALCNCTGRELLLGTDALRLPLLLLAGLAVLLLTLLGVLLAQKALLRDAAAYGLSEEDILSEGGGGQRVT